VLDKLSGMGLNNRYENAYFDEGKSSLTSSTLSGGEAGIETAQWNGQVVSASSTATHDTITGTASIASNPTAAILVASDQTAGDLKVSLTATGDGLDTSNAAGIVNQSTSAVTATKDWWGDASGPSLWSFGSGASVSADVNFFPWATDSTFTGQEGCTSGTSVTANANDEVLCAPAGTSNAYLANGGDFKVLIIGNHGDDQLLGHRATGETWIIGGTQGTNVINGRSGVGFIQKRGNHRDSVINAHGYTVAAK
jgi:hypothetical protein